MAAGVRVLRAGLLLISALAAGIAAVGASAHVASNPCAVTGLTNAAALATVFGKGASAYLDSAHPNGCEIQSSSGASYGEVYVSPKSEAAMLESEEVTYAFNRRTPQKQATTGLGSGGFRYTLDGDSVTNFTEGSYFVEVTGTPSKQIALARLVYGKLA